MLKKLKLLSEIITILRKGENIGDVAVLKLAVTSKGEEKNSFTEICNQLKEITFQPIQIEELSKLPKNSFGFAYFEFMQRNKLKPFNFTKRVYELADKFPVTTRYARVHDMIHTLLGFEADLKGELGVYAFIYEQKYSSFLNRAYKMAKIFTRVAKPMGSAELKKANKRGKDLSIGAKILISEKLEEYLPQDLSEVRRQLVPAYFRL